MEVQGQRGENEVFLVRADLDPEAAPDFRSDDANLAVCQPERRRERVPVPVPCA
jgi:hypothetical protein